MTPNYHTDLIQLILCHATRRDALDYFKKNYGMSGSQAYRILAKSGVTLPYQNKV